MLFVSTAGGRVPYQGDIVLTTDQELELLASTVSENDPFPPQYAVLARSSSLWPGGVVPYVINSNLGRYIHACVVMIFIDAYIEYR